MPSIHELGLFDSCITIGTIVSTLAPKCLPCADDVIKMMDFYGIEETLVHEHHARSIYPLMHGNERLLEMIAGHPRLHPMWVLEPPRKPNKALIESTVSEMIEEGVRAARLVMKRMRPLPWLWDDLCSVLAEHRVPCFLDFGHTSTRGALTDEDIKGVREIARAHPHLHLILSHVLGGLGIHPAILPLMYSQPNVYIDIASILEYWREVAREIGPGRVIFGTCAPFTDPGILVSNVQYEESLDLQAKTLICGGNLRRLLGQVR